MDFTPALTRREFVVATGIAAGAALVMPRRLLAQDGSGDGGGVVARMRRAGAEAKISVQPIRGGLSVLLGAGGNIAVLSGPDGMVLVDAGLSTARRQVSEALAAGGGGPVRYLINTHWHFDHTDGNEWLHSEGAVIVARAKCRERMAMRTRVEAWGFTFDPSPAGALPVVVFDGSLAMHANKTTILLESLAPSHTDTDLWVEFREQNVVHLGDVWWNGHYPFIDYSTGGSIGGTIRAVEQLLTRVTDDTVIIPGHGPVGTRGELVEFRDMLVTVRDRVGSLKNRGMSLAEVIAAKPTEEFDGKYGHFLMAAADFCGLVYAGV